MTKKLLLLIIYCGLGISTVAAQPMDASLNASSIIDFPTALNQRDAHNVYFGIQLSDLTSVSIRARDFGYSFQYGIFQIANEFYMVSEPYQDFGFYEIRLRLQLFSIDSIASDFAIGGIYRLVPEVSHEKRALEGASRKELLTGNRDKLIFLVWTSQFLPFDHLGAYVVNIYVDNLQFDVGMSLAVHPDIWINLEYDFTYVKTIRGGSSRFKIGAEFEIAEVVTLQTFFDTRDLSWVVSSVVGF